MPLEALLDLVRTRTFKGEKSMQQQQLAKHRAIIRFLLFECDWLTFAGIFNRRAFSSCCRSEIGRTFLTAARPAATPA